MIRRPPRSTRTDTLFPYTTLFRTVSGSATRDRVRATPRRIPPSGAYAQIWLWIGPLIAGDCKPAACGTGRDMVLFEVKGSCWFSTRGPLRVQRSWLTQPQPDKVGQHNQGPEDRLHKQGKE